MRDVLGPGTTLGYGTNVHAGATLDEVRENLDRYATAVRARVCPDETLGLGLWLPAAAARGLRAPGATEAFAAWLAARGLAVFTINGFPQSDFHRPVVKHDVYHPTWATDARRAYTIDLVHVAAGLAGEGGEVSISTLPVGWRPDVSDEATLAAAAANLRAVAVAAAAVEREHGVLVHVDLEPEPGCLLDRSDDVVRLFEDRLLGGPDEAIVRRHLRVCHDVCHAAVMFEDDAAALDRYDAAGLLVGKVQLSSAVRVRFDRLDDAARAAALAELAAFGEDRYLHQTTAAPGAMLADDLPAALAAGATPTEEWRVHYHVPVYAERLGHVETTRPMLARAIALFAARDDVRHFEVETYAWDVLPEGLARDDLAEGIAEELRWVRAEAER
jgi:hypothetical protein